MNATDRPSAPAPAAGSGRGADHSPNAEKFFSALDACFCLLSHGKTLVETGWPMTEKDKLRVVVELQDLGRCAAELARTIERKS